MLASPNATQTVGTPIAAATMATGAGVMCGSIRAPFSASHFNNGYGFARQSKIGKDIREPGFRMPRFFSASSDIVLAMAPGAKDGPSSMDDSSIPPAGSGNDGDGRVGKKFLRERGETATVISFERDVDGEGHYPPPSRSLWEHLRHGDIVYNLESYRGEDTWIVVEKPGEDKSIVSAIDEAGYAEIDSPISKFIADPVEFYAAATDVNIEIITTILFDTEIHREILKRQAGGREVHPSRNVWWSTPEGGFQIDIPPSPRYPHGYVVPLDDKTPGVYLQNVDTLDPDQAPIIAEERRIHRIYNEERATEIFREMKKGDWIDAVRLPKGRDSRFANVTAMFERAEPANGSINRVIIKAIGSGASTFTLRLVELDYGPYKGLKAWVGEDDRGDVYILDLTGSKAVQRIAKKLGLPQF